MFLHNKNICAILDRNKCSVFGNDKISADEACIEKTIAWMVEKGRKDTDGISDKWTAAVYNGET